MFFKGNVGVDIHIDISNMSQIINEQGIRNRISSIKRLLVLVQNRLKRLEVSKLMKFQKSKN